MKTNKMMDIKKITDILKKQKSILRKKYKVKEIGIFGSYVRGEERKVSDIDILIEFEEQISLLDLVGVEIYISDILGIKADVVPEEDIRPELKSSILNEAIYI